MESDNQQTNISDASQPNAGRIYDYFLGGSHNFEIDRKMAEQIEKIAPFSAKIARLVRWFLGEAIRRSLEKGYTQFLDFASGLPTVDHIHSIAPEGTKVIYSDIDPVTVRYAQKIIGENPNVVYEVCDAAHPEILLKKPIVQSLFDKNKKLTIGFNGICWFLSEEQISHSLKVLYDWAEEETMLFTVDLDGENPTPQTEVFMNLYKSMNQFITTRPQKTFKELIKPWKLQDPGFLPLEEWVGMSTSAEKEVISSWGGGGFYGGFLVK